MDLATGPDVRFRFILIILAIATLYMLGTRGSV